MSRRVFFSFHYQRDIWRANVIRNSGMIEGVSAAGFADASLWEETKKKGDAAIKALIDRGLDGTSVTVVLIGAQTASRKYVDYEVRQSLTRGNGLLGIRVDSIKDQNGQLDSPGAVPAALAQAGVLVYSWEYGKLGAWVEAAFNVAARRA
jgi:MTH538 TIR-like domain (DUF1863)